MRTIKRTNQFKKDYKRETKGAAYDRDLAAVAHMLVADGALGERHKDHALTGEWKDHRDCHVRHDLVLIYRKPDDGTLELVRFGSHSKLGLK